MITLKHPGSSHTVLGDPVNYAFDVNNSIGLIPDKKSQTGFYPFAYYSNAELFAEHSADIDSFPDYKFLVGILQEQSRFAAGRRNDGPPLAWWWCAAISHLIGY